MEDGMPTRIPGLRYLPHYLSPDDQTRLLDTIDRQTWSNELRRRVQHYGYRYDYKKRAVDSSMYLGPLPGWLGRLSACMNRDGLSPSVPDQVIINEYQPGQGIASHVDCEPCFGDTIISLSLGSPCVMVFTNLRTRDDIEMLLEPGSLLIMQGEARHRWMHGIPARKTDVVNGQPIQRGRRVSVTLRTVILEKRSSAS
jgi:alkylated DNA repair dioxygenase AlkB